MLEMKYYCDICKRQIGPPYATVEYEAKGAISSHFCRECFEGVILKAMIKEQKKRAASTPTNKGT